MGGMGMYEMGTEAGSSFLEELGANKSVSGLVLSNNISYNLHSFIWELVHLGKSLLSKIACVEQKIVFSCVYYIKQYPLFSY